MKILYIFYLYDKNNELTKEKYPGIDGLNIIHGNDFNKVLYGWTINKNIRKKFKKQRDMKIFKEVVCEIETEDFDKFSDEYSNTFLEERPITTKALNEEKIFYKETSFILATRNELDYMVENASMIMQKLLEDVISSNIYIREKYFIKPYRKALHFFKFDDVLACTYPLDDDDIPFIDVSDDNLAIYTHLYYNTYRKD
jgi:hypothetical protein